NWDFSTWQTVSASNGTLGAGLGAPRVAWAPDFGPGSPDTVPPVASASLSGTSGAANWYVSPVNVTLSATDDSSGVAAIHFRADGGPWQLYRDPVPVSGEGSHTIDYYATDLAGNNESALAVTFHIDTVAPVTSAQVTGTLGGDGWYVSSVAVTLTATSGSGIATTIAYRIDGNAWVTYSQPFTLPDGRHVLVYQATDADGYSEVSKSSSFNVDSAPPSVLANSPSAPIGPDDSLSWSGSDGGSGIARYELSIDGAAFVSIGLQTTLTRHWSVGTHVVVVRAYDAAGNAKSSPIQFSVAESSTPTTPSGPSPPAPPGIPEIIVGLLMLGISMWFRPRVKPRRRNPPP